MIKWIQRATQGKVRRPNVSHSVGRARVRALKSVNTHVCFEMANHAAELVNGWFLAPEICTYNLPGEPRFTIGGDAGQDPEVYEIPVRHPYMNIVAQMTDVWDYMHDVAGFSMPAAEVGVGGFPDFIGVLNGNRAFAPCFNISWSFDVTQFMFQLLKITGQNLGHSVFVDSSIVAQSDTKSTRRVTELLTSAGTFFDQAVVDLATAPTTPTNIPKLATDARNKNKDVLVDAGKLLIEAQLAEQAANDLRQAADLAAAQKRDGHPDAEKTARIAEGLALTLKNQTIKADEKATALLESIQLLNGLAEQLAFAAQTLSPGRDSTNDARLKVQEAERRARYAAEGITKALDKVTTIVTSTVGGLIGGAIGFTVGSVFEIFAGADVILPTAEREDCIANPMPPTVPFASESDIPKELCTRPNDPALLPTGILLKVNDPSYRGSTHSRLVPTHEYGHYALCSLMAARDENKFARMYGQAAADGVAGQTADKPHVYINEGFADFVSAQVVGGADYFDPPGSLPDTSRTNGRILSGPNYCPATAGVSCL